MIQTTATIMMIRPLNFGFNEETASNNSFQVNDGSQDPKSISSLALVEFEAFADKLKKSGIQVIIINDTSIPVKPDAIFPNNWISTHAEGIIVTYPMFSKIRRNERRNDIVDQLMNKYKVSKHYSFEHYEEEGLFLEGTGSLILDRENRIAYANLSGRTDLELLEKWCILMNYEKVHFWAKDKQGLDIYHTNVIMSVGEKLCIICLESIPEGREKKHLLDVLKKTNKTIIDITFDQVQQFAGNMLEVKNNQGDSFFIMSSKSHASLKREQLDLILPHCKILTGEIPTIEKYGGGSVRCMMAEIFLTEKNQK
jgi:hypothetical protein